MEKQITFEYPIVNNTLFTTIHNDNILVMVNQLSSKKQGLITTCFKRKTVFISISIMLLMGICLLGSFRSPDGNNQPGEYITMRIYENFTVTSSRIVIVYADDKSEIIELVPFKFNDDFLVKNNQIITQTLNKLKILGYKIVTSTSNGKVTSSRNMLITTFILEK